MAAGIGGARPYTPKKPDPNELDAESLFSEYQNLQRRNKWLRGVRLDLLPFASEGGESGHFRPDYMEQDPSTGKFFMESPAIKLFLPSLRRAFESTKAEPRVAGHPYRHRDFTKYVKAILRHEAAHANQMQQNRLRGIPEFGEPPLKKPIKGRASYVDVRQHGVLFNILNRILAGAGSEALLPSIGLPHELARARWQQSLRTTGKDAKINLPVWGGRG